MSGIQANTLVDFSVFSIYDPNDAAKRILAMPSSCKNLDSMISGIGVTYRNDNRQWHKSISE